MSFDFKFARNFNNLTPEDIDLAYMEVSTMYAGVNSLWKRLDTETQSAKRTLCMNYLVGWYLADMFPMKVKGIDADGRPISSKSIGGTSITFVQQTGQDSIIALTSNTFGLKAKAMIESCSERMGIYG